MTSFADMVSPGDLSMPAARTVARLRPARKADPYNPDRTVEDPSSTDRLELRGFIASSSSTETPDGAREETVSSAVLTVADPGADVRRGDIVETVPPDGRRWRVTGFPSSDESPFTGWRPTLEAQLEEVVG